MNEGPFILFDTGATWLVALVDFVRHSFVFGALKVFLFVYVGVLLIDTIMLLMLRGMGGDLKMTLHGTMRPLISRNKMIVRWEKILSRVDTRSLAQCQLAVLEAEALAEEILVDMGWKGPHLEAKLANVTDVQLESRPGLLAAHAVRNAIIQDPHFALSPEDTRVALEHYQRFFQEVELL